MIEALAISVWLNVIQIDVIRQLSKIEVDRESPVYWKNTLLRIVAALIVNVGLTALGADWIRTGIMQAGVYSLAFSIPLNAARKKPRPLLYMGKRSLPERIFRGKPVLYLISKVALFGLGIAALWL